LATLIVGEAMDDAADRQTQELVDLTHPIGIALGQIVIDRDDMNAASRERVEIDGGGGDEGLAFAGLHLGDLALMQHHAAHQLDIEMALAQGPARGLADRGKGVGQEVVQIGALASFCRNSGVRARRASSERSLTARLAGIDGLHEGVERLDLAVVCAAENALGKRTETEHRVLFRATGGSFGRCDARSPQSRQGIKGRKPGPPRGRLAQAGAQIRGVRALSTRRVRRRAPQDPLAGLTQIG